MLLENGAEINNKDNIGDTPLNDGFIITYKGFLVFFFIILTIIQLLFGVEQRSLNYL